MCTDDVLILPGPSALLGAITARPGCGKFFADNAETYELFTVTSDETYDAGETGCGHRPRHGASARRRAGGHGLGGIRIHVRAREDLSCRRPPRPQCRARVRRPIGIASACFRPNRKAPPKRGFPL